MRIYLLDGREVDNKDINETQTAAEVITQIGGKASYLVSNGKRLCENDTLENYDEIIVGEDISCSTTQSSLRQRTSMTHLSMPTEMKSELHDYLPDREILDLNHFVRWLLQEDVVSIANDILTEKEELASPDIDLEERLHSLHPIPDEKLSLLMDMGFSENSCRKALWLYGLDTQRSLHALLESEITDSPISKVDYKLINRCCSDSRPDYLRTDLQSIIEEGCLSSSQGRITDAIEDAIYKFPDIPSHDVREAFLDLARNPQSIFKHLDNPSLAPFFDSMRLKGPSELQLLQVRCF